MARVQTYDGGQVETPPAPVFTGAQAPPMQPPMSAEGPKNTGISGFGLPGGTATPPTATPYTFDPTSFERAFGSATAGKSGTLQEWQQSIFPSLQAQFPDIQSFGSKGDKIRLPNGQVIDAVVSAGLGGRGYSYSPTGGGGDYSSDPMIQQFLSLGQDAISRLTGPQSINPTLQAAINSLMQMSSAGAPHMDMSYMQPLQAAVDKRQGQINQPGWSPQQQDILRTQVSDPLMAERDAARQRVLEHLAQQGIPPESGIAQQALMDTDRQFQQQRTTGERDLATKEMAQEEARQQEGVSIHQMLASLGLSGAQADLQGQVAGRGQSIQAAGALGNIGQGLQDAPIQALMQAMGISQNMAAVPFQMSANAIAAQNSNNAVNVPNATDQSSVWKTLLDVATQGEGAFTNFLQNNAGFWQQLGMSMPQLIQSFSTLFPKQPTVPHLPVSSGLPAMPGTPVPA